MRCRTHLALLVLGIVVMRGDSVVGGVTTFTEITHWYGTGVHQAAMVVDWGELDRPPLVFGYQWDGTATGKDMFLDVVAAEPALYAKVGIEGAFGLPIYGVGVDRDADGFGLDDGTLFTNGIAVTGPSDFANAIDADDSYLEGWASAGFWAYFTASSSPYNGTGWDSAQVGASDRVLVDGSWDGFRFAPGFTGDPPRMPENLPEPSTMSLGWLCILLLLCRWSRA